MVVSLVKTFTVKTRCLCYESYKFLADAMGYTTNTFSSSAEQVSCTSEYNIYMFSYVYIDTATSDVLCHTTQFVSSAVYNLFRMTSCGSLVWPIVNLRTYVRT